LEKKLPRTRKEAIALLRQSVAAEEILWPRELALVLWHLGTIKVGQFTDMAAHKDLPLLRSPCPIKFDQSGLPKDVNGLLGTDLGLVYRSYIHRPRTRGIAVVGIPDRGAALAEGFASAFPGAVKLTLKESEEGFELVEGDQRDLVVIIVDNAASTGLTAEKAVLAVRQSWSKMLVHDVVVLMDCEEGAKERLAEMSPRVRLVAASRLRTIVGFLEEASLIDLVVRSQLAVYHEAVRQVIARS